ncbi:MAG: hypothetical protein IH945_09460 [Armatimonadetes bacterium]|nr:hypothetical protein [Armatimonadota bacterium]
MALTKRQLLAYEDTVDIWDPPGRAGLTYKAGTKQRLDTRYAATPAISVLPCLFMSAKEDNRFRGPTGRSEQDNLDTLDQFHFEAGTDVVDQSIIRLTTVGHPMVGQYFVVMGAGRERPSRLRRTPNYKAVFAKRQTKPKEIS